MKKDAMIRKNQIHHLTSEREILSEVSALSVDTDYIATASPQQWIVKLFYSFQVGVFY